MAEINQKTLTSEWGGLSPHLIASFYPVDRKGVMIGETTVKCALTESNIEFSTTWQSPFENEGIQNFNPTLQQKIQAGLFDSVAESADSVFGTDLQKLTQGLEGRTSITKLSSTQVYIGNQPAKFNVTALFRAWQNPITEVHQPFDQLMQWALPVELSKEGSLALRVAKEGVNDHSIFPSKAPVTLALNYKGSTYWPIVIESITKDTNAPIDANGRFVELSVPMILSTLTAIDRNDYQNFNTY